LLARGDLANGPRPGPVSGAARRVGGRSTSPNYA